jgi:imidazolonepropionase-like amidohydrolase
MLTSLASRLTFVLAALATVGCAKHTPLVSRAPGGSRSLVIRNVRVFDAPRAVLLDGTRDVVVRDGRIVNITAPGVGAAGSPEVDGAGGTLLPGLVDVHAHTGSTPDPPGTIAVPDIDGNLAAFLYAGVTTVLDLGSLSPAVFRERADVASGARLGPHVYAAGPIFTAPGGHPAEVLRAWLPWYLRWYVVPRATREVATPEEASAAVTTLLPEHPDILKIATDAGLGAVPCLAPDTLAAVTRAGHAGGVRSIAHVGSSAEAIAAVQGGVDALAHAPWRDELSDEAVALIASRHVSVVATLAIWDLIGGARASEADYLPIEREVADPALRARLVAPPDDAAEHGDEAAFRRAAANGHAARRRNVAKLRAAGVTILVGSDACNPGDLPGAGLHLEIAKLVEAGLTPGEALRAATWENARFLAGDGADFGEIAVGKRADLVLVAGDPTARIEDLGRITHVVLEGADLARSGSR